MVTIAMLFGANQVSNAQSTTASNALSGTSATAPTQYLGSSNAFDVVLKSNNTERMRVTTGGNVGIGTTTPSNRLHIAAPSTGSVPQLRLSDSNGFWQFWGGGDFRIREGASSDRLFIQQATGRVGLGTAAPSARLSIVSNNPNMQLKADNGGILELAVADCNTCYNSFAQTGDAVIRAVPGNTNNNLIFAVTSGATSSNRAIKFATESEVIMQVLDTKVVQIGNVTTPSADTNYKLYVEKGILTERLKIALKNTTDWADYVFADTYQLKPLSEVEAFVKANKHLPEVPSAQELVDGGGIDVNQMLAKQMQKIEELTLYVIELNKQNEALKAKVEALEKQ